ncbi:hypothetical protein CANCADRAFT_127594 [Tortispora caseinolytica NRRL Y-17796]|uniref:Importin N-terminal domain-containing protein n=1 Tax=Tortispora caseinolytica NRRL Y-17796 TaxID=767744 RepID=A0A1E4TA93_9ASCO|nr:hypothetical protein CANCADRAFT_127594 [Tortispora caseinolytica NRRL Y-17796]
MSLEQSLTALFSTDNTLRAKAASFLEEFQRSPSAWTEAYTLLANTTHPVEWRLFAAQTLRSKTVYDLHQLPESARDNFKSSLLALLKDNVAGSRPILVQLCIALANLAFYMPSWTNVIECVTATLMIDPNSIASATPESINALLLFLKVFAEEGSNVASEYRSPEVSDRISKILANSSSFLFSFLSALSSSGFKSPLLFSCLAAWIKEIPVHNVISSPLLDLVFQATSAPETSDAAFDCIVAMIKETRDVDDSMPSIEILYPRVMELRPLISSATDDPELFRVLTRVFAEAGEAWHMLIAKMPRDFRPLVEAVSECTELDADLEVVQYTFLFWEYLKHMIVLERYAEARKVLADIYLHLVDVIISHLRYPSGSSNDLFEGDKENEDNFRSFRHEMGDVLKDCCAVVGAPKCLNKAYEKIKSCYASGRLGENVSWQDLEAPLFSMRAMAREVSVYEDEILSEIMKFIVQMPPHPKVRYAATLVLGRYTEWTAEHPEFLESQINYIIEGLSPEVTNNEIKSASSMALMHFCRDCSRHLQNFLPQLLSFYETVYPTMVNDKSSMIEIADGVAHVVANQTNPEAISESLKLFVQPTLSTLGSLTNESTPKTEENLSRIADEVKVLETYVQVIRSHGNVPHPCVPLWMEIWPSLASLVDIYGQFVPISETVAQFTKSMLYSYRHQLEPILPSIVEHLVQWFEKYHYGCFLWVSGVCIREFTPDPHYAGNMAPAPQASPIFEFTSRQISTFFRYFQTLTNPNDISDTLEDFFRLLEDVLAHMPFVYIVSDLLVPSIDTTAMTLATVRSYEPIYAALNFLRDLVSYGLNQPPTSAFSEVPEEVVAAVQRALVQDQDGLKHGERLFTIVFMGMLQYFPRDCSADAASFLLAFTELIRRQSDAQVIQWISSIILTLTEDQAPNPEKQKLISSVQAGMDQNTPRLIRTAYQDFATMYIRRNVKRRSSIH